MNEETTNEILHQMTQIKSSIDTWAAQMDAWRDFIHDQMEMNRALGELLTVIKEKQNETR